MYMYIYMHFTYPTDIYYTYKYIYFYIDKNVCMYKFVYNYAFICTYIGSRNTFIMASFTYAADFSLSEERSNMFSIK
jgi:hypothetical protein